MNTLTQRLRFRQSVVLYSQRNSVFSAIRKFGVSRATIYRWRKMYDGTLNSLAERSRRPHSHPNQHTTEELKLISDMRRRTLMRVSSYFGLNLCSEAISVQFRLFGEC